MYLLPFKVKSITVENTGLDDTTVEWVVWINAKRIYIGNPVDCICDDGVGGTCIASMIEFEWSFVKKDIRADAYVLITLV